MDREDKSVLAGEYALGLLPRAEALAFESRLASDAELRAELETWQTEFSGLLDAEDTPPPSRVGEELRRRFAPQDDAETRDGPSNAAILVVKAGVILALTALIWLLV